MTNTELYAVQDIKSKTHGPLLFFPNSVEAMRAAEQTVKKQSDSMISNYPADYNLVKIGEYDSFEGKIIPLEEKVILCNFASFTH